MGEALAQEGAARGREHWRGVSRGTRRRGGEAMKLPALPNGDDGRFVEYVELL
jgi:hypothetical protein